MIYEALNPSRISVLDDNANKEQLKKHKRYRFSPCASSLYDREKTGIEILLRHIQMHPQSIVVPDAHGRKDMYALRHVMTALSLLMGSLARRYNAKYYVRRGPFWEKAL